MSIEEKGMMRFRPPTGDVVVRSPEELAMARIGIHPAAIKKTWGEGAAERYYETRRAMANGTFPNNGSITFPR